MKRILLAGGVLVAVGVLISQTVAATRPATPTTRPGTGPATGPATTPGRAARAPLPPGVATPSAMEADATGWIDLLEDKTLAKWKRVKYSDRELKPTDSWSWDAVNNLLVCDGAGAVELYLYQQEFGDGIFHAEWRFKAIPNGRGYNSGVFVRAHADGAVWHQAQVGNANVGSLFGRTTRGGQNVAFNSANRVQQRGKPPGEWNVFEISAKGKEMTLWVNGAITTTWTDCEVPKGMVGLEAEGFLIEFRNVKFKELK